MQLGEHDGGGSSERQPGPCRSHAQHRHTHLLLLLKLLHPLSPRCRGHGAINADEFDRGAEEEGFDAIQDLQVVREDEELTSSLDQVGQIRTDLRELCEAGLEVSLADERVKLLVPPLPLLFFFLLPGLSARGRQLYQHFPLQPPDHHGAREQYAQLLQAARPGQVQAPPAMPGVAVAPLKLSLGGKHLGQQALQLADQLHGAGESWGPAEEDGPAGPEEEGLASLGTESRLGLEVVRLVCYNHLERQGQQLCRPPRRHVVGDDRDVLLPDRVRPLRHDLHLQRRLLHPLQPLATLLRPVETEGGGAHDQKGPLLPHPSLPLQREPDSLSLEGEQGGLEGAGQGGYRLVYFMLFQEGGRLLEVGEEEAGKHVDVVLSAGFVSETAEVLQTRVVVLQAHLPAPGGDVEEGARESKEQRRELGESSVQALQA
eukprot:367344-Hanusia_phi.AAC.1